MKTSHGGTLDPAEPRHVIVGTAGHIDHGKTALVYALTGTDTDRLPEEKQRGITIDLGFAALTLSHPAHGKFDVSLIDVPGHHAFVRNMLAGTGGIDAVLLVIAADEGVKAQTEEHLAICGLLGIERGIVVLTKMDAVSEERLLETRQSVQQFLRHTFLENVPIVAVSALRKQGIEELKSALAEMAARIPARSTERVLRLPLDRVFSMRGFGTVVTGTLHAGTLRHGDVLEQQPAGRSLRVRGLQVHGKAALSAAAPCRVALNLAGVELSQIARGDALVAPKTIEPTNTVDVELTMLGGAPQLKHGATVHVHAFTSDALARVLLFDRKDAGFVAVLARLRLDKPLLLVPGDRLVVRQCSPAITIGGGRVLDARVQTGVRKAAALQWLQSVQAAGRGEHLQLRIARLGADGISLASLVAETGLTAETLRERIASLVASGQVVECAADSASGMHWVAAAALTEAVDRMGKELSHAESLSRAELHSRSGLNDAVFATALQALIASGKFESAGDLVRLAGRGDSLPEPKRRQLQAIESIYAKAELAAPLLADVAKQVGATPTAMRELITLLLRAKRLVRMGADDAFVHVEALSKLYEGLRRHRGESFDVSRFKEFTGLTRKHAIPLLEHLDQARVTRNNGGTRIVL